MNARAEIFSNIRRAIGVTGDETPRRWSVEERLAQSPTGIIPTRGQRDPAGLRALFRAEAERVAATVTETAAIADIPGLIADHLRGQNLPAQIRIGEDAWLNALPWHATNLEVSVGRSLGKDLVCVSKAFAGVAESGTLAMVSGPDNPTTLNFLPDLHIVILRADEIVGGYEKIWQKLRAVYGKGTMPRVLNFITGPSRTRDIAQKSLRGVHGPRNLHIIIVNE